MAPTRAPSRPDRLRREAERAASRFPALLAEAERIASSVALGAHGRRQAGSGETFWEYRRHRAEDGARAVDWRRSARGDHLFVRETEWEAANAIYLWRDGSPGMSAGSAGLPTKQDRGAVCLMAAASLLVRGGERVAALGETGRARGGRAGLEITARALADGPGSVSSVEAPDLPRHARLVLASDFLDPPETWAQRLSALAASGARGVLLRLVDPSEEAFPFQGRTRFETAGGGDTLLFGKAESAREGYARLWAEHGEALRDLARRAGWRLITHRTDRPAGAAVMALYQALDPERS
ncbi:DUF58 domain-containing protein [Alkalicaulis satelles]|uniref:DUF58 domain-containing protein n=1 Tax=Alkalicaulis satelles TaxID=2609175 RepID=A0A5M6ZNJ9_9PROT|nr:DUF58 domain-containing protein [Alkalicaulis satelles]KAA5804808.1 DUF58 domain-containing protein [Alkalicaulis satelles]